MSDFAARFGTYQSQNDYHEDFSLVLLLSRYLDIPMLIPDLKENVWWSREYEFGISVDVLAIAREEPSMATALLAHLAEDIVENRIWAEMRKN
jgi:hypothetical protein|tara:strand:+ start:1424 stop:1702 length:279 start_codon:yes stop_codon:yes gene_type:complete